MGCLSQKIKKIKMVKVIDLILKVAVVAIFLAMCLITIFYITSKDVANCRIWKHGNYNILRQQCEISKNKRIILFQETQK